jgi:hypothetical protein
MSLPIWPRSPARTPSSRRRRLRIAAWLVPPLAAAAACLGYWGAHPVGPDWALARQLLRECRRAEALGRRAGLTVRLNEAKAAATAEALAGRLTLGEAARRFGQAEEAMDGDGDLLCPYRGVTGERGLSLNVLVWAEAWASQGPGGPATLARLEGEYRQRFGAPPRPLSQELPPLRRPASGG